MLWKKRLENAGWLVMAIAAIVLLVVAITKKGNDVCTGVNVDVYGAGEHFFVDAKDVKSLLNATGNLEGRPVRQIDLNTLEQRLENDKWIYNAELFMDNNQVLQVKVEENEPVARVFTVGGYSYYIDSSCKKLPLSNKLSARVPMFTGFPSDRTRLGSVDSSLMAAIKNMAVYINQHRFWQAQVAQININADRELELIPTLGNQVVLIGKPADYEEKLNRLYSFYKQVWTQTGLEKYESLDVRFRGQVVAITKGAELPGIDSVKAKEAVQELMAKMDTPPVP